MLLFFVCLTSPTIIFQHQKFPRSAVKDDDKIFPPILFWVEFPLHFLGRLLLFPLPPPSYDGEVLKDYDSTDATHIITDTKSFAEVEEIAFCASLVLHTSRLLKLLCMLDDESKHQNI